MTEFGNFTVHIAAELRAMRKFGRGARGGNPTVARNIL